jgi:hypothetical protein
MRGAPWEGLFYGFVVEFIVAIGSLTYALSTPDFLGRTIAWALFVLVVVLGVRTLRRVGAQPDRRDRPTGRWWFGG